MTVDLEQIGAVALARITGRVDAYTSPDLDQRLRESVGAGRHLVLDLGGTDYMSSAGLRVLLGLAKRASAEGFELRLCGMRPEVSEVFDIAGVTPLFTILDTAQEALGELASAE